MEGNKHLGSSFTSDLFGAKDSSVADSSSGIFDSIFAPPARVSPPELLHLSEVEKKSKNRSRSQSSVADKGLSDTNAATQEQIWSNKSHFSSYYEEEKVQPFHYNSSIYYGGQDVYFRPQTAQNAGLTTLSKDIGEDDTGMASRGNWWQGSLYY